MLFSAEADHQPAAPDLAQIVGAKMRKMRRDQGLTLKDLAKLCGTSPQTIQRLEAATMTLSVEWVEKICKVLGIRPYLLFIEDNAGPEAELQATEARACQAEMKLQMLRAAVDSICTEEQAAS